MKLKREDASKNRRLFVEIAFVLAKNSDEARVLGWGCVTVIVVPCAGLDFPYGYTGLRVSLPFSLVYLVDTDLATAIINFDLCPRVPGPGCLSGRLVECHRLPEITILVVRVIR